MASIPAVPARGSVRTVRLFDGVKKMNRAWDGLRKDDELWSEDGDCLVHFYARGSSRRGASLRIPFPKLRETRSRYLLQECLYKPPSSVDEDDHSDSGYAPSTCSDLDSHRSELYIPAPVELTRQEAFSYHLGTRNYFAYLLGKPIVGESFGRALAHLWTRIQTWQQHDDVPAAAFRDFCQKQGYLDFAVNLDYAAAALYWSEKARMKDVWIDAFVHCVAMHDHPERTEKTRLLTVSTRALLHQASRELHSHVSRATKSLGTFLEEELGAGHVGLSKPSRDHLDRFRSTLHSFYVEQFGYFPPGPREPWDKRMWARIHGDFHCLYRYLADTTSSGSMTNNHGLTGGICVFQNVKAFDDGHGYLPLKHPLPLMPEVPSRRRTFDARSSLGSFTKAHGEAASYQLAKAANSSSRRVMSNALVQAYMQFERQKMVEKVTVAEARKVRWLLVYGVLQTLISVTKAPKEVCDTETPSYPLCVSTEDCPPWKEETPDSAALDKMTARISEELEAVAGGIKISIQPDCEAETAEDYFSLGNLTRRSSWMSVSMTPPPLRPSIPSRTSSIRSGVTSISRSMVGNLSCRNSHMPTPVTPARSHTPARYSEILIDGYGNGAETLPHFSCPRPRRSLQYSSELQDDLSPPESENIFPLQIHRLNTLVENSASEHSQQQHISPATSHASSASWRSLRSAGSTVSFLESPGTEISYSEAMEPRIPIETKPPASSSSPSPAEEFSAFDFGLSQSSSSSKTSAPPRIRDEISSTSASARKRQMSDSSSVYDNNGHDGQEGGTQAADIEVEEFRGRTRVRGMYR